jgi:hypothetical protein
MNDMTLFSDSWFGIALAIFSLVLLVLWILLPFIVFSIHKHSKELVELNQLVLSELVKLNTDVNTITSETAVKLKCPKCGQVNSTEVLECVKCGYELPLVS